MLRFGTLICLLFGGGFVLAEDVPNTGPDVISCYLIVKNKPQQMFQMKKVFLALGTDCAAVF